MRSLVFEFLESIPPTRENATAIQQLTLQDLRKGGFPEPEALADPTNERMVEQQLAKLVRHPERYCGYADNRMLRAYMKHGDWRVGDELPFASQERASALKRLRMFKLNPSTQQWGVFGLVVTDQLDERVRLSVLEDLLRYPITDPRDGTPRTVNVVIHDHDPLKKVAEWLNFVPVGERAEAAGAPGLMQQRYQRQATN